ncbi:MAG TPA: carboxypeptidase-like regulatory domain-containing protein, partial [Terriglobales bacterium]|nr:carboxypeptidase-like regulatory domain-containing protein [Terriglobales bacterium]
MLKLSHRYHKTASNLFLALFVSLLSLRLLAQTTVSSLSGTVRNSSNEAIVGATVHIEGVPRTVITDRNGRFRIGNLHPGRYQLSILVPGLSTANPQEINIAPAPTSVEITLGDHNTFSLTETKISSSTSGGEDLSSQAVSELPLNKRDFSQLLLLAAGTMTDSNGANNFTQQFAINGQRGVEA